MYIFKPKEPKGSGSFRPRMPGGIIFSTEFGYFEKKIQELKHIGGVKPPPAGIHFYPITPRCSELITSCEW